MSARDLGPAHLEALFTLEEEAQARPWSREHLEEELSRDDAVVRGRFEGELLAGYACWRQSPDELWLLNVAVAPRFRRRGIGRALLNEGRALARVRGCEALWLEVRASNEEARRLYEAAGFSLMGRRRGYYPALEGGGREDALLLRSAVEGG